MTAYKFLLSLLILALIPATVSAATVSRQDLANLQKQVEQKSVEHKRLQAQATKINMELAAVSRQMVQKAKQIQNTEDRLSRMERDLTRLQNELQAAEADFIAEDKNLIGTLYALQNLALKPTESLFVQPLTPVEIIRSAMLLRETVPFLAEEAAGIRKKLESISQKKEQVERQMDKISTNKQKLEKEHRQMKKLIAQKSQMRSKIESQSAKTQQKIKELANQAKDIKELLIKLEKERLAREKIERERREKQRREREQLESYRAEQREQQLAEKDEHELHDNMVKYKPEFMDEIGKKFVKAKGKISKPARGPIVVSYGEETTKGVTSKGISIQTRKEAQVISPFDGAVIFAGPFRGYGKIIIIDHGGGYMTLLAGLENIDCEVGQTLLAGEPIGQMSDNEETNLYVELRKDSRPIDPTAWIAK